MLAQSFFSRSQSLLANGKMLRDFSCLFDVHCLLNKQANCSLFVVSNNLVQTTFQILGEWHGVMVIISACHSGHPGSNPRVALFMLLLEKMIESPSAVSIIWWVAFLANQEDGRESSFRVIV